MLRTVAVEAGLGPVAARLREEGYRVVNLEDKSWTTADCVVVGGMDKDFLEMDVRLTNAPVINAEGRTPESISQEIKSRLPG